jgi:glycosyltransferase involved in cell wall biosynthesis
MKIVMVAIPNHHFFQWVNQLKTSGYEVFWFDVTDGGLKSNKIDWVTQIKGWKLKWNFPMRSRLKKGMPQLYKAVQKLNEQPVSVAFKKALNTIQPDIVHCFEMQLAGLPILLIMQENKIPFIYSSWGSDMFCFKEKGISEKDVATFFKRTNYLITDCKRDYTIAENNGFKNEYLGVFPGNGGITIEDSKIKESNDRNIVLIKGYEDGVGKASIVLKALALVSEALLIDKDIIIYSADAILEDQIKNSKVLSNLSIKIYSRYKFIPNTKLLELMGNSCIHIANSISDGMPNALLEAMSMGAFPIQSNPGKVTEEVITHYKNGALILNPLDEKEIAKHITNAINNKELRQNAQDFNIKFIENYYNRMTLQPQIQELYNHVKNANN